MRDVNKVMLLGRLGADPVRKETKNGLAVTSFSLATSYRRAGGEDGTTEEQTQWHKVIAWGKQAEACAEYLRKGNPVFVQGTMKSRKYDDKEGKSRTAYEVHVDDISFLGGSRKSERNVELEATG